MVIVPDVYSGIMESAAFYNLVESSPGNASLILSQVLQLLTSSILKAHELPTLGPGNWPSRRRKRFFNINDYSSDEYSFNGQFDSDSLPHGSGKLEFQDSGSSDHCYRGECEQSIHLADGHFKHGRLTGLATIVFSNGHILKGLFAEDALQGLAAEFTPIGQITSWGHFHLGWRVGVWCQIEPDFRTLLHGPVDLQGKFGGDRISLVHFGQSDFFALRGTFQDGVLQGPGRQHEISGLDVDKTSFELNFHLAPALAPGHWTFHPPPNLKSSRERILAQSAWTSMKASEAHEAKGAIRNHTLLTLEGFSNVSDSGMWKNDPACNHLPGPKLHHPQAIRVHFFACYPGSGSKWIMTTFMGTSGFSSYGCVNYKEPPPSYIPGAGVLEKTHHQDDGRWRSNFYVPGSQMKQKMWSRWSEDLAWRLHHMNRVLGRAVLLIRNPYEAIISLWNHERSVSYDASHKQGTKDMRESLQNPLFRDFAKLEIELWVEINLDYLAMGTEIVVIHYEDVKSDWRAELKRIHQFLHLPWDEERANCWEAHPMTKFRRSPPNYDDPFTPELHVLIEDALEKVQSFLKIRAQPPLPLAKYRWRSS